MAERIVDQIGLVDIDIEHGVWRARQAAQCLIDDPQKLIPQQKIGTAAIELLIQQVDLVRDNTRDFGVLLRESAADP